MKIVVFIKQVPDTNDVKWTENNNIDRSKMESIMNPADKQALIAALVLKKNYGYCVSAVTMGPDKAYEILAEAVAMGVDEAILLADSKFAGSDTCATSRVLSAFIKEKSPDANIIMFGQSAIDGETSQTGTSTAARLNLPFITRINNIKSINNNIITLSSDTENQTCEYQIEMPCAICINNYVYEWEKPKINDYIRAQKFNYIKYNLSDLNLAPDKTGVKGSPTRVSKVYRSTEGRKCEFINSNDTLKCIDTILNTIKNAMEI
ncbi:MAG: hypothetical protein LUG16_00005 [Candidatus Gastranaerophilales bacterium]|nr:hypothetical protein [Candidatus Gastranaerophilales bacterium]